MLLRRIAMGLLVLLAALLVPSRPGGAISENASDQGQLHAHTHGPDSVDLDHKSKKKAGVAAAPYAVDTPAPWTASEYDGATLTADATDLTTEPVFHALYVYPSDRTSRFSTFAAMFQADARQSSQRLAGMYGRALRFDTRSGGFLDITVVKSSKTYAELSTTNQFSVLKADLQAKGLLSNPNKKYVAWLDAGSSYCGQGEIYQDTRRTADNYNQRTTFAAVYRPFSSTGADGGFCRGRTLAHELGHNMGALQKVAPHAFDGAHCNDSAEDVMCYTSATSNDTGAAAFDYRNDDYWDPAANPAAGSTATLGWWTVNLSKYVCATADCGTGGTTPPPPPPPPSLSLTVSRVSSTTARLRWSGATGTSVDWYRDGVQRGATANDGLHDDRYSSSQTGRTHSYKICQTGTQTCSATVSLKF